MAIIKWDPWRDLLSIPDELERFFGRTFAELSEQASGPNVWSPNIDILETNGDLVIRCELSGINPKDVEIVVDAETLTIKGERKFEAETKDESYHRIERRYGMFRRMIPLHISVDKNNISAKFKNGLLEIRMPKTGKVEPQRVKVEIAAEDDHAVEVKKDQ